MSTFEPAEMDALMRRAKAEMEAQNRGYADECAEFARAERVVVMSWCRALDALADQRDALLLRIEREDPDDTELEVDVRAWCRLARALAEFLQARRAS